MFTLAILVLSILVISFILMILSLMISAKFKLNREKSSPFECGFDSNSSTRLPFSLRFFLITIIFLIFDVEVVLLLPIVKAACYSFSSIWWLTGMFFILILVLGLLHEWNQGALNWSI